MQQGGQIQEAPGQGDELDMSLGKDKEDLNSVPDFWVFAAGGSVHRDRKQGKLDQERW